jgi:membrane-associated protein
VGVAAPVRGEGVARAARDGGLTAMEWITAFVDFVLHLDQNLDALVRDYGTWTYAILCLIIFCETGLVVTPFLPGDSLLFAVGTIAARGSLDPETVCLLLALAAITGDNLNYAVGYWIGPVVFQREDSRLLNRKHLERTHRFYEKYGAKTIILARYVPIVRTFAPFVAGVGRMSYLKFLGYSVAGGVTWIVLLVSAGYFFGNIPIVKDNFSLVILAIIVISVMPAVIEYWRARSAPEAA